MGDRSVGWVEQSETQLPHYEFYKSEAHFHATLIGENYSTWSKEIEKKKVSEQYEKRKRSWQAVAQHKAWGIWYEDNTGSFSVSITVN